MKIYCLLRNRRILCQRINQDKNSEIETLNTDKMTYILIQLNFRKLIPPFFIAKKGGAKKSSPDIYFLKIARRSATKVKLITLFAIPINIVMDKVLQTRLLFLLHLFIFYEINIMDKA